MASMLFDSLPYDASPFARTSFQSDLSSSFGDEAEYEAYEYNHERGGAAPAPVSSAATSGGPASEASPTLPDDIDVFRPAQSVPPGQRLMTSYMMADKAGSGGTRTGKGMHKMQYSHPQQQQHQSSPAHSALHLAAPPAAASAAASAHAHAHPHGIALSVSPLTTFSAFSSGSGGSSVSLSPVGTAHRWTTSAGFATPQLGQEQYQPHPQQQHQGTPSYTHQHAQSQGQGQSQHTPLLTTTPISHPHPAPYPGAPGLGAYTPAQQAPLGMAYRAQPAAYGYTMGAGYPAGGPYMHSPLAQAQGGAPEGGVSIYVPPLPPFPASKPSSSARKTRKTGSGSGSISSAPEATMTPHTQHTQHSAIVPMHTPPVSAPPSFGYYAADGTPAGAGAGLPPHMAGPTWAQGPDTPTPVRRRGRAKREGEGETPSGGTQQSQRKNGQGLGYSGVTYTPSYTPQSAYGQPLPPSPPNTGPGDAFATEPLAPGAYTPGGRRAASVDIPTLERTEHVRRRSAVSSPGAIGEEIAAAEPARRARGLEIKRSKTEGRRLAFPDSSASPEPELAVTRADQHRHSIALSAGGDAPQTPPAQIARLRSPRTTAIPALTLGADGTAAVGQDAALESDIAWLAPRVDVQESPAAVRKPGDAPSSGSEKKRKRIDAFRAAQDGRRGKTTMVHGYGRVATGKSAALKFLGMNGDEPVEAFEVLHSPASNVYNTPTMGGKRTMPSSAGLSAPGPSTPRQQSLSSLSSDRDECLVSPFSSPAEPAWPDAIFPWAEESLKRRKQAVKIDAVVRMEKLAFVERYLDGLSDADSDDDVSVGRQGVKGVVVESDAIDALVRIKRGGAPVFDESVHDEIGSRRFLNESAMGPTLEDESGCICCGQNKDGGGMVCCDGCSGWFHMACFGIQGEEDLGSAWFCWQCELKASPPFGRGEGLSTAEHISVLPEMPLSSRRGTFAAVDETEPQNYHSHAGIGNTALAPSPVFSSSGRLPSISGPPDDSAKDIDSMDTPRLSYNYTPRIPSTGTSRYGMLATPGTPFNARSRVISYAEHYNVCQTPGDTSHEYKKIYSTPKFEDFFEGPFGATPFARNPTSPTPSRRKVSNRHQLAFTTPSTSQSFLQGLQSGSSSATPGLEHLSSGGVQYSPYPASPFGSVPQNRAVAQISDASSSPSPLRHRRQVSFNRTAYTATSSHLRDSIMLGDDAEGTTPKRGSLDLGGELVQRKGKAGEPATANAGLGFELDEE